MNTELVIEECVICGETKECDRIVTFGFISYWCNDCTDNQEGWDYLGQNYFKNLQLIHLTKLHNKCAH